MSNHRNHRREEEARTETGPTWENRNPGAGCNSTHVARARAWWSRRRNRLIRRTGKQNKIYIRSSGAKIRFHEDELED